MAVYINTLNGGNITIGANSQAPTPRAETRIWWDDNYNDYLINGALSGNVLVQLGLLNTDAWEQGGMIFWQDFPTKVEIGTSVTSIDSEVFSGVNTLTSVQIPSTVTTIGDAAFSDSGLTGTLTIPGVTSIGDNAFFNSGNITSVTIGNSVTQIGSSAFDACYNLETITILGKTTAAAQTLLANAGVPEGCEIVGELG